MSLRRNPNHRPPGASEGGPRPPVQQERLPALPAPGPEGGRGHRPPRPERDREDDGPRDLAAQLTLQSVLHRDIGHHSGGELQRTAIAATMLKDADVYFFDEPSSYLDIYQRLEVAKVIQSLSKEKRVIVVEHDLAVLDFL